MQTIEAIEEDTRTISEEKNVTGSLVIPLSNGLKPVCQNLLKKILMKCKVSC